MEKKCYSVNVHHEVIFSFDNIIAESEAEAEAIAKELAENADFRDGEVLDVVACVTYVGDVHGEPRNGLPSCPKCGTRLVASDLPQYDYYCRECDEDFYNCEV